MPTNILIQGLSGLTNLLEDNEYIPVTDGFMLQDIDFGGKTWYEIEQTIGRLQIEAEIRKSRTMTNQNEQERKAAEQAFWQRMSLLDEFEEWLYERKFGQRQRDYYQDDEYGYDYGEEEDDWER